MRGVVVVGLFLGGAAGCGPAGGPPAQHLVITGSYTMAPLVRDIADRFRTAHPGVRVDVQPDGTARGVRETQEGLADVGMVGRALHPDETGLQAAVVARDGIALVVHRDNPIKALAEAQVVSLFTRSVATWKPLGGPDVPVTLVALPDDRALSQSFQDHYNLRPGQVRPDVTAADSAHALEAVAGRPEAIGYADLGPAAASGLAVRLLPCAGIAATPANVANGSYPMVRPLLLVTRGPPAGAAGPFVEFARSAAVRDLLEKYHLTPPAD
jgi:phosphate transport system substrate-binding protein